MQLLYLVYLNFLFWIHSVGDWDWMELLIYLQYFTNILGVIEMTYIMLS